MKAPSRQQYAKNGARTDGRQIKALYIPKSSATIRTIFGLLFLGGGMIGSDHQYPVK